MTVAGDPLIGTEFLGYRIEELIGRGGMGVVYRAYDLRLKRNVALKLIAPELSADEGFRERFLAESELAASLDHPNVIPIYNAGEHEGQLYLAMRYVEGSDLKTLVQQSGPLDPQRTTAIVGQVAQALDAAHARGLVHRDVKPSNVLLDTHEHVYLADFGLSRRLSDQAPGLDTTLSLGTPAYVAPEQIEGDDVDARADVYSLGCLLYECLTGEPPYPRESELAVLWAHLNDPPPAPPGLEQVMATALAKEPEQRYPTCGELVEAAREGLGLTRARDRRPLVLAATGALVAAAALATGLVLAFGNDGTETKADLTVRNNTLVRVDADANRISGVTPVGHGPQAAAGSSDTVWTYNWDDRTVSQIDAATGAVVRTVSVSGSPPFVPSNSLAADETGAWVISSAESAGLLTHLRPGLRSREFPFDGDPVAVASGAGSVWVATKQVGRNTVLRVDPQTGAVLAAVRIPSEVPTSNLPDPSFPEVQALTVGEGGVWVLVGGAEGSTVIRIDPSTARITRSKSFASHGPTSGLSIVAGNGAVWTVLAGPGTAKLVALEPRTLRVKGTRPSRLTGFGSAVESLVVADDSIWWNNGDLGTLLRIDPRTYKVVSSIRITPQPDSWSDFSPYAVAGGGDSVWVSVRVAP
jgi:DNA-binding beta-propeller fold protein YncE